MVGVRVGVTVGVEIGVFVGVGVLVAVGVAVAVGVGVAVGCIHVAPSESFEDGIVREHVFPDGTQSVAFQPKNAQPESGVSVSKTFPPGDT